MQLDDGLWVRNLNLEPILEQHKDGLSQRDADQCQRARHSLCLDLPHNSFLNENAIDAGLLYFLPISILRN